MANTGSSRCRHAVSCSSCCNEHTVISDSGWRPPLDGECCLGLYPVPESAVSRASTITCAAVLLAALPAIAWAQAAIVGSVTDPTGAPLSGVAIEAQSPALIERSRVDVTDNDGRYRIDNLRPGSYLVRFVLEGWRPIERRDVELTGAMTATVDATFVLAVSEAVSVASEPTLIDVYGARHEMTLGGDLVRSIPNARSYNALLPFMTGVLTSSNDVVTGTATTSFPIYGGRVSESRLLVDGLTVGSAPSGNSATSYVVDVGAQSEVTFASAAASGEVETAGLMMNITPKSGGNVSQGSMFVGMTATALQSSNLTQTLKDGGVTAATPLAKFYDVSGTFGGPVRKDRAWFFVNAHTGGHTRASANTFYNLNAGVPTEWLYAPDYSQHRVLGPHV